MLVAAHLDDAALWEHALGVAHAADEAAARAHLADCAACRSQLEQVAESGRLLAAALPQPPPPPSLWARLEQSLTADRWGRLVAPLAALLDVDEAASARQLARLGAEDAWAPGPLPGLRVRLAKAGPACAGAYTGFFRLQPGARFPAHAHGGPEATLILAGGLRQHDGRELHAGERIDLGVGSVHAFVALPGEDCIAAVVQHGGIDFAVPPI